MDKFYFDPITNSRFDTMEELENSTAKFKIQGYPVYRIQHAGITLDCVADQDVYAIYINAFIDSHISSDALTQGITDVMPENLDGTLDVTLNSDNTTDIYLNIYDYSHMKMLNTDMLADRIFDVIMLLADKKREG